jgi:Tfp pilus assembly protein PilN
MTPRWPRPDFLAAAPRRPPLAYAWALAAVLVAATAIADAVAAKRQRDVERARLAHAIRRLPRQAAAPSRPPASAGDARAEAQAVRDAREVSARLAHPWDRILVGIEAESPPGLQWLRLDHGNDDPVLQLEGVAPDAGTVLQLVRNLSGRGGWKDVALSRLQSPDAGRGGAGWRFELRAVLDLPRLAALQQAAGE